MTRTGCSVLLVLLVTIWETSGQRMAKFDNSQHGLPTTPCRDERGMPRRHEEIWYPDPENPCLQSNVFMERFKPSQSVHVTGSKHNQ